MALTDARKATWRRVLVLGVSVGLVLACIAVAALSADNFAILAVVLPVAVVLLLFAVLMRRALSRMR